MDPTSLRGGASAPPRFLSALFGDWPGRSRAPAAAAWFRERAAEAGALDALTRARAGGRRVIGVFCTFIPDELLLAVNAVPVRLCGGAHGAGGDLPRDTCPVVRAALDRLQQGPLTDLIDGVIVPTTCDWKVQTVARLASTIPVWHVEVPRTPDPTLLAREFRQLADGLAEVTDHSLTGKSLREAVGRVSRARAAHRCVEALRRLPVPPISGCEAMLVADAYGYGDIDGWTDAAEALAENGDRHHFPAEVRENGVCPHFPRILLAGSPTIWPNFKVPHLVERSGGVVVGDDFCSRTSRLHAPDIEAGSWREMLQALARRSVEPCTCGILGQRAQAASTVAQARELDAHGVVCHYLRGCAPVAATQNALDRALREAGFPVLALETDASEEDMESLRTRIEAFLEVLSARG